jgi:ketosteroid isomerase-like protein
LTSRCDGTIFPSLRGSRIAAKLRIIATPDKKICYMIPQLFNAIDNKDHFEFSRFLTPDCTFRFGNQPEVVGSSGITEYVKAFFDSLTEIKHEVLDQWDIPSGKVCHGTVTYTRKDGSELSIPFANIFEFTSGKVSKYLIFADTSEL